MLSYSMQENSIQLFELFHNPADLYSKDIEICGLPCQIVMYEDISSLEKLWNMMLMCVYSDTKTFTSPGGLYDYLLSNTDLPFTAKTVGTEHELVAYLTAGFSVIFIDGVNKALLFATQDKPARSVSEPSGEGNLRGSREGFNEVLRQNMGLIRRRIRSEKLRIETLQIGTLTKTETAFFYMDQIVSKEVLKKVKERIAEIDIPMLFEAGYLSPFLERKPFSILSGIGYTERPDTLCAKICEGKVAILIDGSPFALILPYFFTENFQSMDDYASHPYFASFIRILKYFAFFVSILLPGLFVALLNFIPQTIPWQLLYNIAPSEKKHRFRCF